MKLAQLLLAEKAAIVDKWFDLILTSYPADAAQFFRKKSTFTNPVGHAIAQGIDDIFDGIVNGDDLAEFRPFLDSIIRVRAVQEFTASNAVIFIFHLKSAIRAVCGGKINAQKAFDELAEYDRRIDELALMSFDIFMQCREKIYDLKANELRDRTLWLLKRTGFLTEIEDEPGASSGIGTNVKPTKEVN
ncbi:MAG TPA: RsbRD N-terminal domain-containing protein [Dissulfurispiraceae bacterium]|nr:RsbRD N-terminal domain-containing protein [Dissulfurispiraceae bacterium]